MHSFRGSANGESNNVTIIIKSENGSVTVVTPLLIERLKVILHLIHGYIIKPSQTEVEIVKLFY